MNTRRTHLVLIILAVATFTVTLLPDDRHREIKGTIAGCTAPAQGSVAFIRAGLLDLTATMERLFSGSPETAEIDHARDEAEKLRQLLVIEKSKRLEMEKTIAGFAAFTEFTEAYGHEKYSVVPAAIIGRDPSAMQSVVVIDKGTADGIRRGAGVVWGYAAVGVVAEARSHSSLVNLLTSPACRIPAYIQRTGESTLVEGDISDTLRMPHIFRERVKNADYCLTSGELGTFPRNILIGQVAAVSLAPGELFQQIAIRPHLNLSALQTVIVLVGPEWNLLEKQ